MSPRVWFITGASTGFGRHLTELVLAKGEIAIATARRPSALSDLQTRYPIDRLLVVKLDVNDASEIEAAFAHAKASVGRIDVVVNNAGWVAIGEVESVRDADARAMFETNFWGAATVSREAVRFFREVNPAGVGGRLIQISSMVGVDGRLPAWGYFAASKFALEGLTEALATEIDPAWNIKITIVEPGVFSTEGPSKIVWPPLHPAYDNPDLPSYRLRNAWEGFKQVLPGDVKKAVQVIYDVAALPEPPLHLPLGKDAVETTRKKAAFLADEANKYESLSDNLNIED
ncbi:NAD-P-binding protein [Trametes elegans]|nr:NAD-P-binding protein [Trametes elegans]